jgi:multiple sugar transport system permease protein
MVSTRGIRKWGWVLLFLAPSFIGLLIFVIGPILVSLGLTTFDWNLLSAPEYIGLGNFTELFQDGDFWRAFRHTLTFIVLYLPLVLVLALGTALLLNQRLRGIAFFRASFFVPVVSSWVVVSVIWRWLFNPRFGLVNFLLAQIGISGPAWLFDPDTVLYAIVITSVWKDLGFVAVMYLGGLQGIPESYYEAARIDGGSVWDRLRYITLPLLTPTTFFAMIMSLINSFQVFDQVWLMPEPSATRGATMVVEQIVRNAFSYNRMGYALAMSWVLFVVIFIITFFQLRLQDRWVHYEYN